MNIDKLKTRFSNEMLTAIRNEVEVYAKSSFTSDEYAINKHLVDFFFTQPIFYATLINYFTMYEQNSVFSLQDIFNDDLISDAKKNSFFLSIAENINIDTTNLKTQEIISAIENRLTVSDSGIHFDMMNIVKTYSKGQDGSSGIFWNMFRNSPDIMYFNGDKFSMVVLRENLQMTVPIEPIMNYPITLHDSEKYNQLNTAGRISNMIDIYLKPDISTEQITFSANEGEEKTVTLPYRKWVKIKFGEDAKEHITCTSISGGYMGFEDKEYVFKVVGPFARSIYCSSIQDDTAEESSIKSLYPQYDISFSGLIPVELSITVQNGNGLSIFQEEMVRPVAGSHWVQKIADISNRLNKNNNGIVDIEGLLWINAITYKKVKIFNNKIAIPSNSALSWIDIGSVYIGLNEVINEETGDVDTF